MDPTIPQPVLLTRRMRLAPFALDDAPDVFEYARDPEVSKYTTWRTHTSIEDAKQYIHMVLMYPADQYCWAVRLQDESRVIGAIEVGPCQTPAVQIDYVLAKKHWNRALMTEAFGAVMAWALAQFPQIQRIHSRAVVENIGSRRVMEKNGLSFERLHTELWAKCGGDVTQAVYSISRQRWAGKSVG